MNQTAKLILSLSLSGSILAALIFALKPLIKHRISKSVQYYIWIVVLIRLILPFSLETSIMHEVFYSNNTSLVTGSQIEKNPVIKIDESSSNPFKLPDVKENAAKGIYNGDADHSRYFRDLFYQYLIYIWLIGVMIALTINLFGYFRFTKYIRSANEPSSDRENRILMTLLKGDRSVRLVRNRFVTTPMLIGIIRPLIIIPDTNYNENQLRNILLHEITHLKHFDIGIKWLIMIAASLHWFNPLMHFIKKEINHACELSCDEIVIKNLNSAEKQAYGDTLMDVVSEAKYPAGVLQATMSEEKSALKERLVAIMKHSKKSKKVRIISACLFLSVIFGAVTLGGGVVIGKDGSHEEKYIKSSVHNENIDSPKKVSSGDESGLMPEFTDAEVSSARKVVEEYFRATEAKDDEAILATWHHSRNYTIEKVRSGNVALYGTEIRTLLTIKYDSQDRMRRNYRPGNSNITAENIIVFKVSFNIEYPLKDGGPWNEGVYDNWGMILIRDNKNSPWFIYDQGY